MSVNSRKSNLFISVDGLSTRASHYWPPRMPSLFHDRRESSPEPLPDGGNPSGPSISPGIVTSEATEGEDHAMAQKLDGAFTSINASSQGFNKYQDSRSRKIVDSSGGSIMVSSIL